MSASIFATACQPARSESTASDTIVFEGTLVKLGPDPGIVSGRVAVFRLAKFRVDKVCSGKYEQAEIVVDQLVFNGKEFENIKIGDRVCVRVKASNEIAVRNNAEGMRSPEEVVSKYYVASETVAPVSDSTCCTAP